MNRGRRTDDGASDEEIAAPADHDQLPLPVPAATEPLPVEAALRALPVAGISRRRVAWLVGAVVTVWIVTIFARQVGEAAAAADRADQIRAENAALAAQITLLEREREAIGQRSFVEFMARGFGLGTAKDHRFTLSANAPPLPSDAPGSAGLRVGRPGPTQTPFESWLSLLFGPPR